MCERSSIGSSKVGLDSLEDDDQLLVRRRRLHAFAPLVLLRLAAKVLDEDLGAAAALGLALRLHHLQHDELERRGIALAASSSTTRSASSVVWGFAAGAGGVAAIGETGDGGGSATTRRLGSSLVGGAALPSSAAALIAPFVNVSTARRCVADK
jgi:hypothetical protein